MPGTRFPIARPATPARPRRRATPGFTLVELLTVIVIISILMSITMTVQHAITTKQNLTKATTEMQAICNALEQFKKTQGEYPPDQNDQGVGSPYAEQNLAMALTGRARWTHDITGVLKWEVVSMEKQVNDGEVLPLGEKYKWGIPYLEAAKFTIDTDPASNSGFKDGAIIHDPWWDGQPGDNAYLYRYKTRDEIIGTATRNWQAIGFLLVSRGPDQQPADADSNFVWAAANGKAVNSGLLDPAYSDPSTNPQLADNIVMGTTQTP